MGISKWLVAAVALVAVTNVQAQEKTRAYIAPFAGYTHLRLDEGTVYQQDDLVKFDALTFGAIFGFQTPVGFLAEISRSHAIHADLFDEPGDFELLQSTLLNDMKCALDGDSKLCVISASRHDDVRYLDSYSGQQCVSAARAARPSPTATAAVSASAPCHLMSTLRRTPIVRCGSFVPPGESALGNGR